MKKEYIKPTSEEMQIDTSQMLASSITGYAPDSDDSEFGAPMYRRGEWGNLWNEWNERDKFHYREFCSKWSLVVWSSHTRVGCDKQNESMGIIKNERDKFHYREFCSK